MIRAFIAIQFPNESKQIIEKSIAPLNNQVGDRAIRWVKPLLYHLTLKFIGDVDDEQLHNICKVLSQVTAIHRPFQLEVGNFGAFPSARKPRVLWVGLREKTGYLASLKSTVERELEPHGFEVERRNFHPHITVGRVRRNASKKDLELLMSSIEEYELGTLDSVKVDEIELVRSDLRPSGPIYSTLRAFPLGT